MKKLFAFLLAVLMLSSALFSVSVSAEILPEDTVHVTSIFDEAGLKEKGTFWNIQETTEVYKKGIPKGTAIHIGKFDVPTVISEIYFKTPGKFPSRFSSTSFEASADGKNWTEIARVNVLKDDEFTKNKVLCLSVSDRTAYQYIRVIKNTDGASGGKELWWHEICVGIVAAKQYAPIEFFSANEAISSNTVGAKDHKQIWNPDFLGKIEADGILKGSVCHTGKFVHPTVIDQFVFRVPIKNGNRLNGCSVEASVDNQTWTPVAVIDGIQAGDIDANKRVAIDVNDHTAYRYIRVVNGNSSHWTASFFGVTEKEKLPLTFGGHQSSSDGTRWKVRLIACLNSLEFEQAGFEITVNGEGLSSEKHWDRSTSIVFSSIMEGDSVVPADTFGCAYLAVATVENISIAKYGKLTFTVKPYVLLDNGKRQYGTTQVFTYEDSVLIG